MLQCIHQWCHIGFWPFNLLVINVEHSKDANLYGPHMVHMWLYFHILVGNPICLAFPVWSIIVKITWCRPATRIWKNDEAWVSAKDTIQSSCVARTTVKLSTPSLTLINSKVQKPVSKGGAFSIVAPEGDLLHLAMLGKEDQRDLSSNKAQGFTSSKRHKKIFWCNNSR